MYIQYYQMYIKIGLYIVKKQKISEMIDRKSIQIKNRKNQKKKKND